VRENESERKSVQAWFERRAAREAMKDAEQNRKRRVRVS
jgi:hypothetical protein